jgi:regulator of cell morphogenesis and NO signaling
MNSDAQAFDLTAEKTVNEIVAARPETLPVFKRFGIDTCCGGGLALAEVARRHRIEFMVLLAALERV